MRRGLILIILLINSVTCLGQTLGFQFLNKNTDRVTIPFELKNNLIIIPVVLNDILPLKFILDTGVRTSILVDKDFSDILNLEYSKKYTFSGLGNEKIIEAYIAPNVSITLPGIEGNGHAILVLEKDLMELRNYLGTDVHGIIGYELFSRFVVDIDYVRNSLTIIQPSSFKSKRRFRELDMTVEDTKPYIFATLEQDNGERIKLKLMVDSGSSQSLFIEQFSDPSRIRLPEKTIYANVGRGLAGAITGEVGRLPNVQIADYILEDVIVNYPDEASYKADSLTSITDRNGTIGGEVLSRFRVIFNFPRGKLYIKKNSQFRQDFTYNLSGMTVKAVGSELNIFEISEVRKGSPAAEAGIKAGDQIIYINGLDGDQLQLDYIIGILNSRSGKKIRLQILRDDKIIAKKFRLRDVI